MSGEKIVLLVTDGARESEGALNAAHWIAHARGFSVERAPPLAARAGTGNGLMPASRMFAAADAIRARAVECRASLIILGAGHHADDAVFPDPDDVVAVAERATIPVWFVPPWCVFPPRRILLGTDFSRASIRAGRMALCIAGPHAEMDLAYVALESPCGSADPTGPGLPENLMLLDALDSALGPLSEMPFGRALLSGEPSAALLAQAAAWESHLLGVGSHGRYAGSPVESLGGVARQIVRAVAGGRTACSVLLSGALTGVDGAQ